MGWAIMYNGAWDYAADTRGYTWGWVHEFHTQRGSLRYGSAAMPKTANGLRFDRRLFRDRSDVFEGEVRIRPHGHDGAVRLFSYINHADAGKYADAIHLAEQPGHNAGCDGHATRLIADQEIAGGVGVFGRLGWSDGKTATFVFTPIDRLATLGVSITGARWKRPHDTVTTEVTASGLAGVHALYLAPGGSDFMLATARCDMAGRSFPKATTARA
jgi:hypothetical protein